MDKIKIAYDDNLGLPADFVEWVGCDIVSYHDLSEMTHVFEDDSVYGMFIPAGTLPYLQNYEIISQALFGSENKTTLQSNFVSTNNIILTDFDHQVLGRVNQYCTTSFWAPLIYLKQFLPKDTTLNFKNTNGFADMLHKAAMEEIDGAMVWDIILQQRPQDAAKVQPLFNKSDLPTPVIVIRKGSDDSIKDKINTFITSDKKAFFNGFRAPEVKPLDQFVFDMKAAQAYFHILQK